MTVRPAIFEPTYEPFHKPEEENSPLERYAFTWMGKQEALRLCYTPTRVKLVPHPEESVGWDQSENLFIEGDNLDALKCLTETYRGQVKMIYIDPPYNTGKDFVYLDNYSQTAKTYLEATRQVDSQGKYLTDQVETNGRHHSAWLSMLYPRLAIARQLLQADGLIFVSIDDNEVHNLKMIMNEIFGEENFVTQFVWHSSTAGGIRSKYVNQNHEYALCYAKDLKEVPKLFAPLSPEAIKFYNREDARGPYREKDFAWRTTANGANQRYLIRCPDGTFVQPAPGYLFRYVRTRFEEALKDDLVVFKPTKTSPLIDEDGNPATWNIYIKKHLGDGMGAPSSLIPKSLVGISNVGTSEIKRLFGEVLFNNPKSTRYLRYFLQMALGKEDLVLDFFAGSCSTAHAVLALNAEDGGKRRFIMIQIPEPIPHRSLAHQAGYRTIADLGKERIRRVLAELDGEEGFRVYKMTEAQNEIQNNGVKNE